MTRTHGCLVMAAALAALAGCSAVRPSRRPEGTFEALRKALRERDHEGLWNLLSEEARQEGSSRIRAEQTTIEASLKDMTPEDKAKFAARAGVQPETYVNMPPAEAFAFRLRKGKFFGLTRPEVELPELARLVAAAEVEGLSVKGDGAVLRLSLPDGEGGELTLLREHGLYRLPGLEELSDALNPAERKRRPGRTPEATFKALLCCVRDGAYEDMWELLTSKFRERLAETFEEAKKEAASLPKHRRRLFERRFDVSVPQFLKMSPKEVLALNLRDQLSIEQNRRLILLLKPVGTGIQADMAAVHVALPGGGTTKVSMAREGGRWRLTDLPFRLGRPEGP